MQQLPLAIVKGTPLLQQPDDLYIPPDALEVFLEAFEGPLDLLLYLIRKQKVDIIELSVLDITRQYMAYIELMQELQLDLAAEYLLMAAFLAEAKSKMLLPRHDDALEEEEDPRIALLRRLQEYEVFKDAAARIDLLERAERDFHVAQIEPSDKAMPTKEEAPVMLQDLIMAMCAVMRRAEHFSHHQVEREQLSTRARMSQVLDRVSSERFTPFEELFDIGEGKAGVVVTFLAILELVRESLLDIVQNSPFETLHVRARTDVDAA